MYLTHIHLGETADEDDHVLSLVPSLRVSVSHTPGLEASAPGLAAEVCPAPLVAATVGMGCPHHDLVLRRFDRRTLRHGAGGLRRLPPTVETPGRNLAGVLAGPGPLAHARA